MPDTPAIESRFATVNGVKLHYLAAGTGDPVILLHGYAQTSHMWRPLMAQLAKTHSVIASDLRGFGRSDKPARGYGKKTMARDIHGLAASFEQRRVKVADEVEGVVIKGAGHWLMEEAPDQAMPKLLQFFRG